MLYACYLRDTYETTKFDRTLGLRRDSVDALLHFAQQIPHAIFDPLRLQAHALPARPVHSWRRSSKADVHTSKVKVERRHVVRGARRRLVDRRGEIRSGGADHIQEACHDVPSVHAPRSITRSQILPRRVVDACSSEQETCPSCRGGPTGCRFLVQQGYDPRLRVGRPTNHENDDVSGTSEKVHVNLGFRRKLRGVKNSPL